jgi:hypothetical protein
MTPVVRLQLAGFLYKRASKVPAIPQPPPQQPPAKDWKEWLLPAGGALATAGAGLAGFKNRTFLKSLFHAAPKVAPAIAEAAPKALTDLELLQAHAHHPGVAQLLARMGEIGHDSLSRGLFAGVTDLQKDETARELMHYLSTELPEHFQKIAPEVNSRLVYGPHVSVRNAEQLGMHNIVEAVHEPGMMRAGGEVLKPAWISVGSVLRRDLPPV